MDTGKRLAWAFIGVAHDFWEVLRLAVEVENERKRLKKEVK